MANLKKLQADLHALQEQWHQLCKQLELLKDENFLKNFALSCSQLHEDLTKLKNTDECTEDEFIVDYLLTSPWGAPFIFEHSLIAASDAFLQNKDKSQLLKLLEKFTQHKHNIDQQLFDSIQEIEDSLDRS